MINLNKKQKLVIIILISFIISIICYYIYLNQNNMENLQVKEEKINITNENITLEKSESNKKIIVHIAGAVKNEGIIETENDSRISEVINKAGGLKENANISDINLAYKVEDGMKIYIPTNKEVEENKIILNSNNQISTESSGSKNSNELSNVDKKKEKVNINTATQTQLELLPGIGPSTALKIIEYRKENGKFKNIEEIKNVTGIGESKYKQIKNMILV